MKSLHNEQRRIVAYLDSFPLSRDLRQARLASLRGLVTVPDGGGIGRVVIIPERSEWDTVRACPEPVEGLDRAFKGEL